MVLNITAKIPNTTKRVVNGLIRDYNIDHLARDAFLTFIVHSAWHIVNSAVYIVNSAVYIVNRAGYIVNRAGYIVNSAVYIVNSA